MEQEADLSPSLSEQPVIESLTKSAGLFPPIVASYQNVNIEINPESLITNPIDINNSTYIEAPELYDQISKDNEESNQAKGSETYQQPIYEQPIYQQPTYQQQTYENQSSLLFITYLLEEPELKSRLYEIVNQVLSRVADASHIEVIVNCMINKGKYGVIYPIEIENVIEIVNGKINQYLAKK